MQVIRMQETCEDTAGELSVLLTLNDRMILRHLVSFALICVSDGLLDMDKEDLVELIEFSNRMNLAAEEASKK